jgi:hypothetical protein
MDDNFFDKDGKLKIIKQWMFRGDSYSARRDSGGYIRIVWDDKYWNVGNAGVDFCFRECDIDNLARKLGVK